MTTTLRPVTDDLWETPADNPVPGLTTHAYLWRSPSAGNVLFYSVATDAPLDALAALGGVSHQYLSHRDEAGPALQAIRDRFGARLHAPAAEAAEIGRYREPDELLAEPGADGNGVQIVPTPGHSPGSTAFLVEGAGGRYLFVGDTIYRTEEGTWAAGYLPGISDRDALLRSLDVLAALQPDLVISSAFAGDAGAHPVTGTTWARILDEARGGLVGTERSTA